MAPNLLGKSATYAEEPNSAEAVQIISTSKPGFQHEFQSPTQTQSKSQEKHYKHDLVWRNIILFIYLHIAGVYGMYDWIFLCQWKTLFYTYFVTAVIAQGVTSGAHRLWAHRAYKARLPLRIFFAFLQTCALQNHLYEWCRDHRVHHKFTDTDADPHNSTRGFFFSHMGWLLVKKHKDVVAKGKTVDLSDLEADPVVRFQRKYYMLVAPICAFVLPAFIPWYYWNEDFWICWNTCAMFRYVVTLHGTWLVNSAAHMWGTKPYDRNINPVETKFVSIIAFGEGWHNYHHAFPWDYKAAELGNYSLNFSTAIIDFFSKIGLAYDLKTVSVDMIHKRAKRTGDGSYKFPEGHNSVGKTNDVNEIKDDDNGEKKIDPTVNDENSELMNHDHGECFWGWGDRDMNEYDKKFVEIS